MATIKIKNKTTSGTPSSLAQGELAVNIADKKLFVGGSGGSSVVDLEFDKFDGGTITTPLVVSDTGSQITNSGNGSVFGLTMKSFSSGAGTNQIRFIKSENTQVGSIVSSYAATAYNTSSDYRLKEDIQAVPNATARTLALKPCNFQWIGSDYRVDGFIAHEVADQVPEAVTGEKDAVDADGNPEYQGIDQSKLVPLLVKTIQELEARITTLENA